MSSPTASPSQPNVAQIPLPPGMTQEQFLTLEGQLVTIAIVVAVAFGVVVWDYFALLPDEIALYSAREENIWKTPVTWLFVILRYSGILATLPALFFTSVQSQHCQVAVVTSQVGAVLVIASSGGIFCYRVAAIWGGAKPVVGFVCVMYLVMLGCWIAVATQYEAITGPPTPFGSNCQMLPIVSWAPISFASSVAFDSVVLLFTLAKLHGNLAATKSRIWRQIYQDNLLYFVLTAATNTTVLVIQALGSKYDMIKPTAVPFSTLMTVTMGARVFLNLRLLNQKEQHSHANSTTGIQLSGSSEGSTNRYGVVDIKRPHHNQGYLV